MRRRLLAMILVAAASLPALVIFGQHGDRYGAGAGADCGTDGQCRAYAREVLLDPNPIFYGG